MGANIRVDGAIAVVEGVRELNGAPVRAHDLRAGAAMVIAGLAAKGVTEVEQVQNIERGYELVVRRCADGRHTTTDAIKQIAEGRVWTGRQGKALGLVDVLGGLDTAIDIAADKANLTQYNIKEYPAKRDLFDELLDELSQVSTTHSLRQALGAYAVYAKTLQQAMALRGQQAIMPFNIVCE